MIKYFYPVPWVAGAYFYYKSIPSKYKSTVYPSLATMVIDGIGDAFSKYPFYLNPGLYIVHLASEFREIVTLFSNTTDKKALFHLCISAVGIMSTSYRVFSNMTPSHPTTTQNNSEQNANVSQFNIALLSIVVLFQLWYRPRYTVLSVATGIIVYILDRLGDNPIDKERHFKPSHTTALKCRRIFEAFLNICEVVHDLRPSLEIGLLQGVRLGIVFRQPITTLIE